MTLFVRTHDFVTHGHRSARKFPGIERPFGKRIVAREGRPPLLYEIFHRYELMMDAIHYFIDGGRGRSGWCIFLGGEEGGWRNVFGVAKTSH